MKHFFLATGAAVATLAFAPAATAAVTLNTFTPADPAHFSVSFGADGSISANIGNSGITGDFEDTYNFTLLTDGTGSGGVTATFAGAANFIRLTGATVNGVVIDIVTNAAGFTSASAGNIPLMTGLNSIVISGTAATNASYGGNITFTPNAVPEPSSWAMMLLGFGMLGGAIRYRRRSTKIVYA